MRLFVGLAADSGSPAPRAAANNVGPLWGTVTRQSLVGAAVAALLVSGAAAQGPPRLFLLHVTGMALGACFFLPAAVEATRSRAAAAQAAADPARRRLTLTRHIQAHFTCSVLTAMCWAAGLTGIVLTKNALGKAHVASLHAWLGACAVFLWVAAGLAAERHAAGQLVPPPAPGSSRRHLVAHSPAGLAPRLRTLRRRL